jgi:hypothetical protein
VHDVHFGFVGDLVMPQETVGISPSYLGTKSFSYDASHIVQLHHRAIIYQLLEDEEELLTRNLAAIIFFLHSSVLESLVPHSSSPSPPLWPNRSVTPAPF